MKIIEQLRKNTQITQEQKRLDEESLCLAQKINFINSQLWQEMQTEMIKIAKEGWCVYTLPTKIYDEIQKYGKGAKRFLENEGFNVKTYVDSGATYCTWMISWEEND